MQSAGLYPRLRYAGAAWGGLWHCCYCSLPTAAKFICSSRARPQLLAVVLAFLTALGAGGDAQPGLAVLASCRSAAGQPPVSAAAHGLLVLSGAHVAHPRLFYRCLGLLLMLRLFRALLLKASGGAMPQIIAGLSRRPPRTRPGGTTGGDAQNNAQNSARQCRPSPKWRPNY